MPSSKISHSNFRIKPVRDELTSEQASISNASFIIIIIIIIINWNKRKTVIKTRVSQGESDIIGTGCVQTGRLLY